MIRRFALLTFFIAAMVALQGTASASICDLTSDGASCGPALFNGAIFGEISPQPTGTGFIDSFLRTQANDHEEGYNTNAPTPYQSGMDMKSGPWTHAIQLQDIPVKTINGVDYRQFFLDINENNSASGHLLSLDELRFYVSSSATLDNYNASNHKLNNNVAVWDLDSGSDNWIKLDYSLNHGSGSGDMVAYIPNAVFSGAQPTSYIYLFNRFGDQDTSDGDSDAGFEEWWLGPTSSRQTTAVPEPGSLVLLGSGLIAVARAYRKKKA